MAAALAFSGQQAAGRAVTVNATGLTATTAYVATTLTPQGHTQTNKFTTDGSGAASFQIVPSTLGVHTVTVTPATTAAAVSSSFTAGGHGA